MTEEQYQAQIRAVWAEANQRLDVLIDYLVSQPPIKLARDEARAYTRWVMETGAQHREVVQEHQRRRNLPKLKEKTDAEHS